MLEERLEHMRRAGRARALVLEGRRREEQKLAEEQVLVLQKEKGNTVNRTLIMKQDFEQQKPRDVQEFSEDDDDLDFLIDILLNDGPAKCKAKGVSDAKSQESSCDDLTNTSSSLGNLLFNKPFNPDSPSFSPVISRILCNYSMQALSHTVSLSVNLFLNRQSWATLW